MAIPPLKIGGTYLVPDENGNDVEGILEDVAVLENEGQAYGTYKLSDGRRIIAACPLSDDELQAYKAAPENYFRRDTLH